MRYFESSGLGKVYTIRINPGEDMLGEIENFIARTGLRYGVILTGLATFKNCVLHMVTTTGYPPVEHFERWEDRPLELSAISGVIADYRPHIHMVVSDKDVAYSGHCEPGCTILYLCEIVIAEIVEGNFRRVPDANGINQLVAIGEDSVAGDPE